MSFNIYVETLLNHVEMLKLVCSCFWRGVVVFFVGPAIRTQDFWNTRQLGVDFWDVGPAKWGRFCGRRVGVDLLGEGAMFGAFSVEYQGRACRPGDLGLCRRGNFIASRPPASMTQM